MCLTVRAKTEKPLIGTHATANPESIIIIIIIISIISKSLIHMTFAHVYNDIQDEDNTSDYRFG